MLTKERLQEPQKNIRDSHGWNARETPNERDEIVKVWHTLPGTYSFYDAVNWMIKNYKEDE